MSDIILLRSMKWSSSITAVLSGLPNCISKVTAVVFFSLVQRGSALSQ
jgi:hypothetical protein